MAPDMEAGPVESVQDADRADLGHPLSDLFTTPSRQSCAQQHPVLRGELELPVFLDLIEFPLGHASLDLDSGRKRGKQRSGVF